MLMTMASTVVGDATQIEPILFVLHHPFLPSQLMPLLLVRHFHEKNVAIVPLVTIT
jgi:hypothetical protein